MKHSLICILVLVFGLSAHSQNTQEILDKAKKALEQSNYHVDVEYNYEFLLESGNKEKTRVNSFFRQFEDGYVHSLSNVFYQIQHDSLTLSIDYEENEIAIDYTPNTVGLFNLNGLDVLDNDYFKMSSSEEQNSYKVNIVNKGEYAPFESMTVFYAKKDFFIQKVIIEYGEVEINQISKLTILYKNKKELTSRSSEDDMAHYIKLNEDSFDIINQDLLTFNKIYNLWK